jgi:hypothetical protein
MHSPTIKIAGYCCCCSFAVCLLALFFINVAVVEILIRAHDCYTAALNMEGIAAVLHQARIITSDLLHMQEWTVMVRTLTFITFNS